VEIRYCERCEKIFGEGKDCPVCFQSLVIKDHSFLIGKELGKYKIENFIGEGGMGAVFGGVHSTLKKPVAIKILIPSKVEESFIKRFKKEAEIMALLKHPNIVEIYDYDISSFGFPYIVMEYLEGLSLRTEILKYKNGLPLDLFKIYIKQIVSGLSFAHKKGVVHRDLKPENIFISNIGGEKIIKILDFGIAKVLFSSDESRITKTDVIIGTLQYLSPEQIMGKEITPKADQYSLALIAFEMLTGKPVREGKTFGEIVSSISTKNVELDKFEFKEIKIEIFEALKRATNKNPENRFDNLEEFEKNLIPQLDEIEEKPTTAISFKKPKRKNFKYYYLFLTILLFLFLPFFYYIYTRINFNKNEEKFSLVEKYQANVELGSYLTSNESFIIFNNLNNLYILKDGFKKEPIKISLKDGEKILCGTDTGKILILKNGKLYLKEYLFSDKIEEKEVLIVDNFIEIEKFSFSKDLVHLAGLKDDCLKLYEIKDKNLKEVYSIDLKNNVLKSFMLGNNYLSYIVNNILIIYDFKNKREILNTEIDVSNFYSMDFFEETNYFAIGGWFDNVYVFDLINTQRKYTLKLPGITNSIKFIKDYPSLLISKGDKVLLWSFVEEKLLKYSEEGLNFVSSFLTPFGIISIEKRESKIYLFSYKDFSFYKKYSPSKVEIWGMDYSKKFNLLFAGSSSGFLYSIDLKKDKIKNFQLHTQGITFVLFIKDKLVTSSDDKTIAVWETPTMNVLYRTEAHNWLINYLYFNESSGNLWSSSSDGFVKVLSFPGLKVIDSINIGLLSNAAIWVSSEEKKLAVGTWNYQFLFFEKNNSKWEKIRDFQIESQAVYSISYLPKIDALILCGVYPYKLYIFFIGEKKLFDLGFENEGINWVSPYNENSIYAAGVSSIYSISFDGNLREAKIKALFNTDLRINLVSVFLKDENIFALGNEKGEVILLNLNELKFPQGYKFKIEKEILP